RELAIRREELGESGEVPDVAVDGGVTALARLGVKRGLDVGQLGGGRRDEFVPGLRGEVGLAVCPPQAVATKDRNLTALGIASADLEDQRYALLDPGPALLRRLAGTLVEQHAKRFAERGLLRQRRTQFL